MREMSFAGGDGKNSYANSAMDEHGTEPEMARGAKTP